MLMTRGLPATSDLAGAAFYDPDAFLHWKISGALRWPAGKREARPSQKGTL